MLSWIPIGLLHISSIDYFQNLMTVFIVMIIQVPKDFTPLGLTLAMTGALKWGTVWTSTSNGTVIMKGQISSKCKIKFELS